MADDHNETVEPGVKTLDSIPNRPLSRTEYKALEQSDAFDNISPTLDNPRDEQVHALSFALNNEYYYFGWNPDSEQWEQIVHIITNQDDDWNLEAVEIYDEDEDEVKLSPQFTPDDVIEDVYDYIWEYITYTYDETDHLWYIPHTVDDMNMV